MSDFKKAARTDHKLRSAVFGPAGSGKTRFALELAKALCPEGKRVAFIDTEGGRAREYADLFDFDEAQLEKFSVQDYLAMMTDAYKSGLYGVLVIDSLSAFWDGPGGILAQKDQAGGRFDAWAKLNPQIKRLMDAIVRYPTHTICTMRTRTEWVEQVDDRGKKSFVSAGKVLRSRTAPSTSSRSSLRWIRTTRFASSRALRAASWMATPVTASRAT
ncbi:MAG: AAA family ATPase [Rhodocyclaceae bacterium]|nr:AAA family ATPase [Rhodocyclaceae bacterium]